MIPVEVDEPLRAEQAAAASPNGRAREALGAHPPVGDPLVFRVDVPHGLVKRLEQLVADGIAACVELLQDEPVNTLVDPERPDRGWRSDFGAPSHAARLTGVAARCQTAVVDEAILRSSCPE